MNALSAFVTNLTQDRFLRKVVDNAYSGNVLTMKLMPQARIWNGGESFKIPVALSKKNNVGSYSGFDSFVTTQEDIRQLAVYYPAQVYASASVSGIQKAANSGDAAVVDLVAQELEYMSKALKDELGDELYGDGTGNANKDILGLQAIVDDSTTSSTLAGISRSTYTNWKATRTAQSGSFALANLAADVDAAQVGSDMPDLIVTTPAIWTLYEALLTPTVSHNFGEFRVTADGNMPLAMLGGNQGFRALQFRGIPVVSDEKCTAQNLYVLNTNHLWFGKMPQPVGFTIESEYDGWGWTGWLKGQNQDAVTGRIQTYLQLITDAPRTMARRTGITS